MLPQIMSHLVLGRRASTFFLISWSSLGLQRQAALVQLHGESEFVGNREIRAALGVHVHRFIRKPQAGEQFFEAFAGRASGGEHSGGFASERVDHLRGVDAASAGGFAAIEDVTAVLKYQAIRRNNAIQGWIDG